MANRKIVGIGETIMDIIFKDGKPTAAVPGGSVFNGIISLGRLGTDVTMITEIGNDRVGQIILDFMTANGVNNRHVAKYQNGRSAISLAWLNERNDAEYMFYKDYPAARLEVEWPQLQPDDIVMMGSYFVLNPVLRSRVHEFLTYARRQGALIYYDLNFRSSHRAEAIKIYADMLENLEFADIVRGSTEDLDNLFGESNPQTLYGREISFYCRHMLCTDSDGDIRLITPDTQKSYTVNRVPTVSTIGAGDNFNAGIVYGLLRHDIRRDQLSTLPPSAWDAVIRCGMDLAAEVCQTFDNSISQSFADNYRCRPVEKTL